MNTIPIQIHSGFLESSKNAYFEAKFESVSLFQTILKC
jgi:hypothetical protein